MARSNVRLMVWNCASGFHRKTSALLAHAPDIIVLSEAPEDCVSLAGSDASGVWIGSSPRYGLAVLGMNGRKIENSGNSIEERLFLPVKANRESEQLHLIGVCAKKDRDYVTPTLRALSRLSAFISERNPILAGDFNQSARFDATRASASQFRRVLDVMDHLDMVSAWHQRHAEEFGKEKSATYFHKWRHDQRFHIDYAFVPRRIDISSAVLGTYDNFVATRLSDHVPLMVDLVADWTAIPSLREADAPASQLTTAESLPY